jgi:mono/diheme cytochrome c family protein
MGIKLSVLVVALIFGSCISEGNKDEVQFTGKELFVQRCASCHGVNGGLQASASPDLRGIALSKLEIMKMIENGGNGMPAFKTIISSLEEKNNIVDHVLTLKK